MRRKSALFTALFTALSASAVLSANVLAGGITFSDNRSASATAQFSETDFETTGYFYKDSYDTVCYYVTVTNNSEATVSVSGTANGYDSNGNVLSVKEGYIDVLGSGETSIICFWFGDTDGVEKVEYSLEYEREDSYKPVISDISVEASINDSNVTLIATNDGKYSAQFVEAYVLFFDDSGNVIYESDGYMTDSDYEIKVGDSVSVQLLSEGQFSDIQIFLTGRSDGTVSEKTDFDDSEMEIEEYMYSNSYSTEFYVAVTNNTDQTVAISSNGLARDKNDNILGAADLRIDVLGPGETSVGEFYFMDVTGIDHVEYDLDYDTDPYYRPVIGNLDVQAAINDNNVVASITNNGTYAAEFVEAICLFMDADNNIVSTNSTYVMDDDSEIKANATVSDQINCYESFDHLEMFLTGRGE